VALGVLGLSLWTADARPYIDGRRACPCASAALEIRTDGRRGVSEAGVITAEGGSGSDGGREVGIWRGDEDLDDGGVRFRGFGGGLAEGNASRSPARSLDAEVPLLLFDLDR
jgi:hypothetical protein